MNYNGNGIIDDILFIIFLFTIAATLKIILIDFADDECKESKKRDDDKDNKKNNLKKIDNKELRKAKKLKWKYKRTIEFRLHDKINFVLYVDEYVKEERIDDTIVIDEVKKYVADRIEYKNSNEIISIRFSFFEDEFEDKEKKRNKFDEDLIAKENELLSFIRLLNRFSYGKLYLDGARVYELYVYNSPYDGGYKAERVSKDGKGYLKIITHQSKEEIYLTHYDCEVIVANFNKIYSQCTRSEFLKE